MRTAPVDEGTAVVDRRRVAYRRYGADPGPGVPTVLSCHGGLSCGADAALGHDAAAQRGLSLLAVDRPGIAGSDPQPGRTTGSFAAVAAGVADHLAIGTMLGAVGWSLGGQYALSCGALLASRVPSVAVVAGVPPLSWPGVRSALSSTDRMLLAATRPRVPRFASGVLFGVVARQAQRTAERRGDGPAKVGPLLQRTWGPADAAVLAGPAGAVIDAAVAEGTRSIDAMREEYLAWARDWGLDLADVTVPVTVWQGDADRWVPMALGERLVAALPDGRLRRCPGEGHLLLAAHWGDVLDALSD